MNAAAARAYYAAIVPVLVGVTLSLVLFGVVLVLGFRYFLVFRHDRPALKLLVVVALLLAVLDTASNCSWAGSWVLHDSVEELARLPVGLPLYSLTIALTSATVQGFFGFSLFKVAKSSLQINSYLLAAVIAVTPIAAFVVNIITCIRIWETPMLRNLINHKTTTLTIFALDLVADTFLSFSLLYFLVYKPKKDSGGIIRSSSQIKTLAVAILRTDLLALALQVTLMALIAKYPHGTNWYAVGALQAKTYIASLLGTLLSRTPPAKLNTSLLPTSTSNFVACTRCRSSALVVVPVPVDVVRSRSRREVAVAFAERGGEGREKEEKEVEEVDMLEDGGRARGGGGRLSRLPGEEVPSLMKGTTDDGDPSL